MILFHKISLSVRLRTPPGRLSPCHEIKETYYQTLHYFAFSITG